MRPLKTSSEPGTENNRQCKDLSQSFTGETMVLFHLRIFDTKTNVLIFSLFSFLFSYLTLGLSGK